MVCCQADAPVEAAGGGLELADLFRRFGAELGALTPQQAQVVRHITNCRTAELGGHVEQCDHCGHLEQKYHSCRDRHCPKCQGLQQAQWLQARQAELLPVPYFHVVFTIPDELKPLFQANQKTCYNLLFEAVAETLKEVALNPDHLGARIGFIAVLHTWTQTLLYHPHVHCIVAGGGLDAHGEQWLCCRPDFFLPVRVLSLVFRGKLLSKLERVLNQGKIRDRNVEPTKLLQQAARHSWVVYSKAPFASPEQVLRYLARYTHRVALSNERLLALQGRQVTLRYKDRADGNKTKRLTLDAVDLLQRFLRHVVPKGLMRIRHYGFLANGVKKKSIALCRELLSDSEQNGNQPVQSDPSAEPGQPLTDIDMTRCRACRKGKMMVIEQLAPTPTLWSIPGRATSP
jgi:hypothetical protein